MMLESIIIIGLAISLDLVLGDPRNRYHPTAWIGNLIGIITTRMRNENQNLEKFGGIFIVLIPVSVSTVILLSLKYGIDFINVEFLSILVSIISGIILFKLTIAIKGMERHALAVLDAVEKNDLNNARTNLSMIVKRNTKNLDKNHILSGTLESLSENIVDGITGPMFYFAIFGLPGAFTYRIVNTVDSMVGYKTLMFKNLGWFGANCDNILNYIPSRLTGLTIVLGSMLLGLIGKIAMKFSNEMEKKQIVQMQDIQWLLLLVHWELNLKNLNIILWELVIVKSLRKKLKMQLH